MRVQMLAALVVISLTGCTAAAPAKIKPIEGPVRLSEIAAVDGPKVRPDQVIEDSRCPIDVQCIHAGRLIVRAAVMGGGWSKQIDLTLGVPVPVGDGMLTLVDAIPCPSAGTPLFHPPHVSASRLRVAVSQACLTCSALVICAFSLVRQCW